MDDKEKYFQVGDRVRMTRRPYFKGVVKACQIRLSIFGKGGGGGCMYFCRWFFKCPLWASRTPIDGDDLELIEE